MSVTGKTTALVSSVSADAEQSFYVKTTNSITDDSSKNKDLG